MLSALVLALALAAPSERVESPFGPVFVVDEGRERFLRFGSPDAADQSVIDRRDPTRVPVEYVREIAKMARGEHFAVLGMGAGVLSRALLRARPNARVDSVEINPVVVELARSRFGLLPDPRHFVHVDDASAWLARSDARFDLIVVDVYQGDDIPEVFTSERFFNDARARLSSSGRVVMNVAMEEATHERALATKFKTIMRGLGCDVSSARVEEGNLLLIAEVVVIRSAL